MNSVLSITPRATEQIKKIIKNGPKDAEGILVGVDKSGCSGYSYKLDFVMKDQAKNFDFIDQEGVRIYIDPKAVMFLVGSVMDYSTDKLSSRFNFINPNEKNTCGCGESFNI